MVKRERFSGEKGVEGIEIFKNLFDNNKDAVVISDEKLELLYYNPPAGKIIPKELKQGIDLFAAFPEIHFFTEEMERLRNGKSERLTIKRDNYILDFSASSITLYGNRYFLFIIRSASATYRKTGEGYFKSLIQQSPIATAIFHPSGRPIYFNLAYGELFSISSNLAGHIKKNYNLLKDEQVIDAGILPFVEKCLSGLTVEIPTIAYNPSKTKVLAPYAANVDKYIKGSFFPIKDENDKVKEFVLILLDITFQKQAEQILTEAHLKFQMLNRNLPGAIYEYERSSTGQGKFIYMSQRCRDIFGHNPEEIMKDESLINEMIHPEDLASYEKSLRISDQENGQWEWEGRLIINGSIKWIEARSSLRVQPDGRKISYGLLLDVTEKKLAEEQYKTAEERLRLALQSADISLWEWQQNSGKVYLNKHWGRKFGYSNEEIQAILGDWRDMIHPEDLKEVEEKLNDLLTGKADSFEAEYRLKCKNGQWSWILDKGKAVEKCPDGYALKIAGTHVDINERKLSESILKKNEQLFMQLFENSPLGIVLLDEFQQVVQINKGFEDLFGYEKNEILFTDLDDVLVPYEFIKEAQEINKIAEEGKVARRESFRRKKNGEIVPVILYGVPVLFNGKTIAIYGIYVDISDRKKAEHELQIRNAELDNFVYKVSHDLRAPLSSILGLVNLAGNKQNNDDPKMYIDLIGQRVKQLDAFIRDVLSHSKNLKLEVSVDKIDFSAIIEQCLRDLNYLPGAEKISYHINISGSDFYSDHWRINEVLRNLLSNAIKYMNPDVVDPYISIVADCNAKKLNMKFSDNGLGIDKSLQSRIFEMFYRATVHSEGSGIGLYIVKNAVQKLGGTIEVMSEPQKGTTFAIEIPNRN